VPERRLVGSEEIMGKSEVKSQDDEMRSEYDFRGGVRGKYRQRYAEGTNVVVLEPDVAKRYKTSEAVNQALRKLAEKEAS